ncbi:MAG: ribosomal protein L4/L1 family-domain-containing protein [Benjaminiella poitrasii]|nr:MAG: ribosomal protein L4/L1 family-domain-containing protein [Benjaminiella poitrasii]
MSLVKTLTQVSTLLKTASIQKRTLATAIETAPKVLPNTIQAFLRNFKTNEPTALIELDTSVFGQPIRRDILHRVVVWQRDNMRQGTHSTKTRSEVRGTSRKLAPQKGRGKARMGDGKAPQFRGGGIAFGPHPRDHGTSLPRKVQELGLRVALSAKYAQDQLLVVESLQDVFKGEKPKTRDLDAILKTNYCDERLLIVLDSCNPMVELTARNLPNCEVIHVEETNVLDLLTYDKLVIEKDAIETLEEALKVDL